MNIRELFKRDQAVDVRVSEGNGRKDEPYIVESCAAEVAALTQLNLLRAIGRGLGELWRIVEWKPGEIGSATEVIRIQAVRYTPTEIETTTRGIYFDTRAVVGMPYLLHPLPCWSAPSGLPTLPYELGWLHFDGVTDNALSSHTFDQTVFYSGEGAKASIYVYSRAAAGAAGTRDGELERASAALFRSELQDPWPPFELGPFIFKFFLSASDVTAVGVGVSGAYFVKMRLTFFDDPKMRDLMSETIRALGACLENALAAGRS